MTAAGKHGRKHVRALHDMAARYGYGAGERTGLGHYRFEHPNGAVVYAAATGLPQAQRKQEARFRRRAEEAEQTPDRNRT